MLQFAQRSSGPHHPCQVTQHGHRGASVTVTCPRCGWAQARCGLFHGLRCDGATTVAASAAQSLMYVTRYHHWIGHVHGECDRLPSCRPERWRATPSSPRRHRQEPRHGGTDCDVLEGDQRRHHRRPPSRRSARSRRSRRQPIGGGKSRGRSRGPSPRARLTRSRHADALGRTTYRREREVPSGASLPPFRGSIRARASRLRDRTSRVTPATTPSALPPAGAVVALTHSVVLIDTPATSKTGRRPRRGPCLVCVVSFREQVGVGRERHVRRGVPELSRDEHDVQPRAMSADAKPCRRQWRDSRSSLASPAAPTARLNASAMRRQSYPRPSSLQKTRSSGWQNELVARRRCSSSPTTSAMTTSRRAHRS